MRNLLYYSASLLVATAGQAPRLTIDELKSRTRDATAAGGGTFLLREADQWRGEVEVAENRYPDNVFLMSGGDNESLFAKLRKAYEEVGSKVQDASPDGEVRASQTEADEDLTDVNTVRAEATALGIPFNESTSEEALRGAVADAMRVKQAATASILAGAGRAQEVNDEVNRVNARVGAGNANARAGEFDRADMATETEDGQELRGSQGQTEEEQQEQQSEMDALRQEADDLGVSYPANIGVDKLREKVEAAREDS